MKREKLLLYISAAIKSTDVDLSVYRALYYIVHLSIEDHLCKPNTSINDDKKYDSDDDDNNDVYSRRIKKNCQQHPSSKSKQIKLINDVLGYGQNGYVYKCLYDYQECATKICDTTISKYLMTQLENETKLCRHLKLLQSTYIPNRI